MRSFARVGVAVALAALGVLAPAAAAAFDYTGRLGLGYDRIERFEPQYALVPRLRLDGFLEARGYVVDRGVVDWAGRVGYEDFSARYGDATNHTNALSYGFNLGLLQTPSARARLAGYASRSVADFSTEAAAVKSTGTSTTQAYGVNGDVVVPGVAPVSAGYSYRDTRNTGFGRESTWESWKTLDLGTQFGQPNLNSLVKYQMMWVDGSLPVSNFTSQQVSLSSAMTPADGIQGGLDASYLVREPNSLSGTNPRYESTNVNGSLGWGDSYAEASGTVRYQYIRSLATEPSLASREMAAHGLSATYIRRVAPEWRLMGSISGTISDRREGDLRASDLSQSVGLTAEYSRPTMGLSFGGRVGVVEPDVGDTALGYGASLGLYKSWQLPRQAFALNYTGSYTQNLGALGGWAASQSLYGDASGAFNSALSWNARLSLNAARSGGGTFGSNSTRAIVGYANLLYWRATFGLEAGTADALSGAVVNPVADALFIPAGFNTHSRYAAATASVPITDALSFWFLAKYTILSGPSTPDQRERLLNPSLRYVVGAWAFSIDDLYTQGGSIAFDHRVNELYVRASRTFGGR